LLTRSKPLAHARSLHAPELLLPLYERVQPTAPAGAFLKAGDFEECFPDLSVWFSQERRLTRRPLCYTLRVLSAEVEYRVMQEALRNSLWGVYV